MIILFNSLMTILVLSLAVCIITDLIFSAKNKNKGNYKKLYFIISMVSYISCPFFIYVGNFKFKSTLPFIIVGCMSLAEVIKSKHNP